MDEVWDENMRSEIISPAEKVIRTASAEHDLSPIEIVTYESEAIRQDMHCADPVSGLVFRVNRQRDADGISKLLDFIDSSCKVTALEIRFSRRDDETSSSAMDCIVGYCSDRITVAVKRTRDKALKALFTEKLLSVFSKGKINVESGDFRTDGPDIKEKVWKVEDGEKDGASDFAHFRRSPR